MKPLQDILTRIETAKDTYDTCKLSQVSEQSAILREFTIAYADLTDHRIEAKERWDFEYFKHNGSNAAREKWADSKVPELYKIRRIMDATRILIDAVRSTISAAKMEQ